EAAANLDSQFFLSQLNLSSHPNRVTPLAGRGVAFRICIRRVLLSNARSYWCSAHVSHRAEIGPSVDQQALAGNIACLSRTQESASITELQRTANALGRNGRFLLGADRRDIHAALPRLPLPA